MNGDAIGCLAALAVLVWSLYELRMYGRRPLHSGPLMKIGANRIVAQDGCGRYLVEAAQADDISGGPDSLLPASVQKVETGVYMVDFTHSPRSDSMAHEWVAASGKIVPRTANIVVEALTGAPEHDYVRSQ